MSEELRRAAAQLVKLHDLTPESDPYPAIVQLAQSTELTREAARYYIRRAVTLTAEGKDPVKLYSGGIRKGQGWKKGRPRKATPPQS